LEPVPPLADEELEAKLGLLEQVYEGITSDAAKLASVNERKGKEMEEAQMREYTYGELEMDALHLLLNIVKSTYGPLFQGKGLFLDLGSGTGKACIAAALLHPFERVVGIEALDCLDAFAQTALTKYGETEVPPFAEDVPKPDVKLIKADFVSPEFDDTLEPLLVAEPSVCLAMATCYGPEQMAALGKVAEKLPDDSYFITTSQRLPESVLFSGNDCPKQRHAMNVKHVLRRPGTDPEASMPEFPEHVDPVGWTEVSCEVIAFAWGEAPCYIFKKVPGPPPPPGEEEVAEDDGEAGS